MQPAVPVEHNQVRLLVHQALVEHILPVEHNQVRLAPVEHNQIRLAMVEHNQVRLALAQLGVEHNQVRLAPVEHTQVRLAMVEHNQVRLALAQLGVEYTLEFLGLVVRYSVMEAHNCLGRLALLQGYHQNRSSPCAVSLIVYSCVPAHQ